MELEACEQCKTRGDLRAVLLGGRGTAGGRVHLVTHVIELQRTRPWGGDVVPFHKWIVADVTGATGIGSSHDEDEALLIALKDLGLVPR